jgi:ubiquitin C
MEHSPGSQPPPAGKEDSSPSSDTSDASVEEIFADAPPPRAPARDPQTKPPPPFPNPTRLLIGGIGGHKCLQFKPSDTSAHVKRAIALKCQVGLSWLTIQNWGRSRPGHSLGGSTCFRDFEDDSTLESSFIGCQGAPFVGADAGVVALSSRHPIQVARTRFGDYIQMKVFGCDRICELKRRIEASEAIPPENQRLFFHGRELPDDFTLDTIGPPAEEEDKSTVLRLVVRPQNPLHISIQYLNCERFDLDIEASDLISEAKQRIQDQEGIGIEDQHLLLGGRDLPDDDLICDLFIENGFAMHLLCSRTNEGTLDGDEKESIELKIQDLESSKLSSITVDRRQKVHDLWTHRLCESRYSWFWLGNRCVNPNKTFEEHSIRDGTNLHFTHQQQIFVVLLTGRHVALCVSPSTYIWDFQEMLIASYGGIHDQQRLVFEGRHLESERRLQDYSIPPDSTLHMIFRMRG